MGNNLVSTFRSYIGNGRLYDVEVNDSGEGYDPQNPPQLLLDTRGGSGAIVTAEMVGGVITNINVVEGGSGYRLSDCVLVEKGSRARVYATYQINGSDDGLGQGTSKIDSVTVLTQGASYETIPDVFIADGGKLIIVFKTKSG